MLAAAFILIQSSTKTPSLRVGVDKEAEGANRKVPIRKTVHQDHVVLRNGGSAASDFIWNFIWNGNLWQGREGKPLLPGTLARSSLSSLAEGGKVSPFPLLSLLKELSLCFGCTKSIPAFFLFQKQLAKSLQPILAFGVQNPGGEMESCQFSAMNFP